MSNLRLFIADDSELMCSRLAEALIEIGGIEIVGIAHDANEAWKSIQLFKPDVAILDICMPGGSGIDVLKHIRESHYPTKVVIFTHYPYPQYRKRCMDLGADYFFDKYSDFEKFMEVSVDLAKKHLRSSGLDSAGGKAR